MKKEDVDFLKKLQNEMKTQPHLCTASPRYWGIRDKKRIYGIDENYGCDGYEIIWEGESVGESMEDLISFIEDNNIELDIYNKSNLTEDDLENFIDFLNREGYDIYLVNYKEIDYIVESAMFLTLDECEKHIKSNKHNYNTPYSYCMCAWRSPQVQKLYEILENTNWDNVEIDDLT